jgi:hypothetical protein
MVSRLEWEESKSQELCDGYHLVSNWWFHSDPADFEKCMNIL